MKQLCNGKTIRTCITYIVVGGMLCIFLFDIVTVLLGNAYEKRYTITDELFAGDLADRIHFLNTDNSDCILLESQGHFALIDSGWGSNNPNAKARRPGYEQRYELQSWHIDEPRKNILDVTRARGFVISEEPTDKPFRFGAMTLQFLNLDSDQNPRLNGENDNSVVTLVTLGKTKAPRFSPQYTKTVSSLP